MKPELFTNTPMKAVYDAVAPDKTKWTKFLEQMIALAGAPFNMGETNIAKITSPVLLIFADNDGLDKCWSLGCPGCRKQLVCFCFTSELS